MQGFFDELSAAYEGANLGTHRALQCSGLDPFVRAPPSPDDARGYKEACDVIGAPPSPRPACCDALTSRAAQAELCSATRVRNGALTVL